MGRLLKFNAHQNAQIFCAYRGCTKKAKAPLVLNGDKRVELCFEHHNLATDRIDKHEANGRQLVVDILDGR